MKQILQTASYTRGLVIPVHDVFSQSPPSFAPHSHRQFWLELRWSSLLMLSKARSQLSTSANFRRASSNSLLQATSRIDKLVLASSSSASDEGWFSFSLSEVVAAAAEARPYVLVVLPFPLAFPVAADGGGAFDLVRVDVVAFVGAFCCLGFVLALDVLAAAAAAVFLPFAGAAFLVCRFILPPSSSSSSSKLVVSKPSPSSSSSDEISYSVRLGLCVARCVRLGSRASSVAVDISTLR